MSYGLKESFRGFLVLFSICVTVLPSCSVGEEMNIETPSGRQLYVSHLSGWKKSFLETTSGQECSSCPLAPSQPCHPTCLSLTPSELYPWRALGLSFGVPVVLSQWGFNLSMRNEEAHSLEHGETCLLRSRAFWPAQKGLFWRWGGTRPRMGPFGLALS